MAHSKYYSKYRAKIHEVYQENKDWGQVMSTAVYSDVNEANEAFVDYVEELFNVKVRDAAHLRDLVDGTDDDDFGYKGYLEIFTQARYSKYYLDMEEALKAGAKYNDLLLFEPSTYSLPDQWEGTLGKNKKEAVLWVIAIVYSLDSYPGGGTPSLRVIAEKINAPLKVMIEADNIINHYHR